MLVLNRKIDSEVFVADNIRIVIIDVLSNGTVNLGIEAPVEIDVVRGEILPAAEAYRRRLTCQKGSEGGSKKARRS